jgi:hypothetical protein
VNPLCQQVELLDFMIEQSVGHLDQLDVELS